MADWRFNIRFYVNDVDIDFTDKECEEILTFLRGLMWKRKHKMIENGMKPKHPYDFSYTG